MATIEPNFESICINPNDDLVLYKKEIVRSRIEKFLYAICSLDTDDLPTPLSRIEELYNCLVTGEDIPTFTPLSRAEKFVMAMLGAYDVELLPTPISRSETLMKKIATGDNNLDDVDNLQSRYEFLLAYIIKAGGFNGGNPDDSRDFYYKLTSLTSGLTTIYDTLNMPVKNAILRGQTLVNLVGECRHNISTVEKPIVWAQKRLFLTNVKTNTRYTLKVKMTEKLEGSYGPRVQVFFGDTSLGEINTTTSTSDTLIFTSPSTLSSQPHLRLITTGSTAEKTDVDFEVLLLEGEFPIEYDIPYFDYMQSVKMPVLTTTGKNLFDINKFKSIGIDEQGYYIPLKFVDNAAAKATLKLKPNTKYVVTGTYIYTGKARFSFRINDGAYQNMNSAFETDATGVVNIKIGSNNVDVSDPSKMEKIMIVESTLKDTYEPFKSNILTCNEEVELRGIGDIKDELNLLTGELMQRIQERVFDGSENWIIGGTGDNYIMFRCENYTDMVKSSNAITCDKYAYIKLNNATSNLSITNSTTTGKICIVTSQTDLSIDNFKAKLNTDKPTIQYQLAEPIVKTVDLSTLDQDGKETELSTFDDITHVIVSSEGLIPTGDIDIARPIQFVDYSLDNGWTTLYNTIEYPVKSAILKGQTLVNLARNFKYQIGWKDEYEWGEENTQRCCYNVESAKSNTKYLIKNFNETTQAYIRYYGDSNRSPLSTTSWIGLPAIITTPTDTKKFSVSLRISDNNEEYISPDQANKNLVVEYQDGMENWDIPYFEGMASVKMPVLTTVGKNLFDGEFKLSTYSGGKATIPNGNISSVSFPHTTSNNHRGISCILQVKPDTNYTISIVDKQENTVLLGTGYNNLDDISSQAKSVLHVGSADNINHTTLSFTTPSNCNYMIIGCYIKYSYVQSGGTITFKEPPKIQLEENSVSTTYEPHKSNILTCNEEVTLRSNGDICDELNLLTGQLTQRIGEDGVVLSQEVVKTVDLSVVDQTGNVLLITENGEYIITENGDYIKVGTKYKEKETVLSTFDDITHVTVSSEELIPTGEITVATKDATDVIDASVMSLRMDDILNSQGTLEGSANAQSDDIDVAMLGMTDIYEQLL